MVAIASIVIAAIVIAIASFAFDSLTPIPQTNTPPTTPVITQISPTTQGKHYNMSLSEGIGIRASP